MFALILLGKYNNEKIGLLVMLALMIKCNLRRAVATLLRRFDSLNDKIRCSLHNSVCRYFVVYDYCLPVPRLTLRTNVGTFGYFDSFFNDFHQYLNFPLIYDCI